MIDHLLGHAPPSHPLSIRSAVAAAMPLGRYEPRSIWEQDTQSLPAGLAAESSAMRGLIWQSARQFVPTQAKSSLTKLYCGDRAVAVCEQAMDLLGNHALLHRNHVEKGFREHVRRSRSAILMSRRGVLS